MAFETIMSEAIEPGQDFEPDDIKDFDDPIFEPETQLSCEESEPEPDEDIKPSISKTSPKTAGKKEIHGVKRKSGYRRKRTFECYRCSLPCLKLYELKTHISIFHPFEEPKKDVLNCPYCTKTTISREILSRHLRKVYYANPYCSHFVVCRWIFIGFHFLLTTEPCLVASAPMSVL